MNRLILLFALVLSVFSFASFAEAQSFPVWGGLQPGAYPVGYRASIVPDRSRAFTSERNYEGKLSAGMRSRPLQIQIFYPARILANATRMLYRDYLNFKADTPAAATVVEGMRRRTQEIHDYYQGKYLKDYKKVLIYENHVS